MTVTEEGPTLRDRMEAARIPGRPAPSKRVPTIGPVRDWLRKRKPGTRFIAAEVAQSLGLKAGSVGWALHRLYASGFDGLVLVNKRGDWMWNPSFGIVQPPPPEPEPESEYRIVKAPRFEAGERLTVIGATGRGTLLARTDSGRIVKIEEVDI